MTERKKVFIIHGRGLQKGLGKESGGDLDTVASNVFYAVWAQNHLKEILGREAVYGQDYAFDFVNYSEGLFHLVVHRGCDIYLPDFPIDALVPRIKTLVISERKAIKYLSEFTRLFTEYRRWISDYAGTISAGLKAVSNQIFLQYAKVIEHQESEAIKTGNNLIYLFYNLAYLDIVKNSSPPRIAAGIGEWVDQMIRYTTGDDFRRLKDKLLDAMQTRNKQDLIDRVLENNYDPAVEKAYLLALKQALEDDSSTQGRINYTDELLIAAVETVAFVVRGIRQAGTIAAAQIDAKLAAKIADDIEYARKSIHGYFNDLLQKVERNSPEGAEGIDLAVQNVRTCLHSLVEITEKIQNPPEPDPTEGLVPIRLMMMYEASGIPVSNIEIQIRRLEGNGAFVLPDGTEHPGPDVCRVTDRDGAIELFYRPMSETSALGAAERLTRPASEPPALGAAERLTRPASEPPALGAPEALTRPAPADDLYKLCATFDDMNYIYYPSDTNPNVDTTSSYIEEGMEFGDPADLDRAMRVSLDLMEREFKFLKDYDITVAAIDDHHPYTPAILNKLHELKSSGFISHILLSSLPRGQELPVDQRKCGADLIYEQYIHGRPWDNAGLSKLRSLAHCQDLALERIDLAMQLSRLIGLKHSKIDMVLTLAETIKDEESMDQIMTTMGWAGAVSSFEGKLAQILPRTEQVIGQIVLEGPSDKECPIHILAVLSPFSDPKKREPQINVASAMGYLLGRKHYPAGVRAAGTWGAGGADPADYFFYCYDSSMMTMRKSGNRDSSLDLGLLAQHLGSPADGGHGGAATCRPDQNPAFPHRLFSKINDLNFLQYLGYLGARIADKSGLRLTGVMPPELELSEEQIKVLEQMRENSLKLELAGPAPKSDRISIQVVKPPNKPPAGVRAAGTGGRGAADPGVQVSYIHVHHYLRRALDVEYLIYCPPGLNSIVIHNINDPKKRLNLDRLAKAFGWSEDAGTDLVGIASGRFNKYIPRKMRTPNREDMFRLCELFGLIIGQQTGYTVTATVPTRLEFLKGSAY